MNHSPLELEISIEDGERELRSHTAEDHEGREGLRAIPPSHG